MNLPTAPVDNVCLVCRQPIQSGLESDLNGGIHAACQPIPAAPVGDAGKQGIAFREKVDLDRRRMLRPSLAIVLGVDESDLSDEHIGRLVTVGKGMFWSEPFDLRAKELAADITKEFDEIMSMNSGE